MNTDFGFDCEQICSRTNATVKLVKKLMSSSRERKKSGLFVLEGLRLCYDAVRAGSGKIQTLLFTKAAFEKSGEMIAELSATAEKTYSVSNEVMSAMADTVNPQGVVCVMKTAEENRFEMNSDGRYIVLHGVSNPDNVGAVSRTAEAFGCDGMIIIGGCDIYNPKALRASMGALLRLPVMICDEDEFFGMCEFFGVKTDASTPRNTAKKLNECDFSGGTAVLIGNEANGLPDYVIEKCRTAVTIPMKGRAESLNAAAAAAVLIYEMTK